MERKERVRVSGWMDGKGMEWNGEREKPHTPLPLSLARSLSLHTTHQIGVHVVVDEQLGMREKRRTKVGCVSE